MIPITQTKVVVNNSKGEMVVRGNCYAAAIASILELPITDVPNVETLYHIEGSLWYEVMSAFIKSQGYELSNDGRFKVFHNEQFGVEDNTRSQYLSECSGKYYIASGRSVRGVHHCVIYKDGIMVHDPHPTREGLLNIEWFESIEKIK